MKADWADVMTCSHSSRAGQCRKIQALPAAYAQGKRRAKGRKMKRGQILLGAMSPLLMSCGLNLYSVPGSVSSPLYNEETHNFLRTGGPGLAHSLGGGLTVKDELADGQIAMLAVSGGGMRASASTLGVLAEFDQAEGAGSSDGITPLERIDNISAISGGAWMVAAVLADGEAWQGKRLEARVPEIMARFRSLEEVKVRCWAGPFSENVTGGKSYGDVYSGAGGAKLPAAYLGSTLYPSQSPFIFSQQFIDHYQVTDLGDNCDPGRVPMETGTIASVPLGFAASASGAVPAFYNGLGSTMICANEEYSFCWREEKKSASYVQLLDGGMYDNIGYKLALEVALSRKTAIEGNRSTIIFIDAAPDEELHTISRGGRKRSHLASIALASSFPSQDATFSRLREPTFKSVGFESQFLIDFDSAGGFDRANERDLLNGLEELVYYAAHDVACFGDDRSVSKGRKGFKKPVEFGEIDENLEILADRGADCLRMNFARVGYRFKTTYKYDEYAFTVGYQLGRFAARRQMKQIRAALAGRSNRIRPAWPDPQ